MHYNIVTFGSAIVDNYIILRNQAKYVIDDSEIPEGKALYFPLGSKIDVEEVCVFSGGGGTNTAATFAKQGFKTAYVGKVGKDKRGEAIIDELEELGIGTEFIAKDPVYHTAYSLIFPFPNGERTIFVCRGASGVLSAKEIPWQEIKDTDWFYLSPLSDPSLKLTRLIVDFASQNSIKVAINPGSRQLTGPKEALKKVLAKADVLFLNQEEASLLTKIPYKQENRALREICLMTKGIAIITKGEQGAIASDGKYFYSFSQGEKKVVDKTGAGDSFGAGFITGLQRGMNIEGALQLGSANARSCIKIRGAKIGLLEKGQKYSKVKVLKKIL